MKILLFSDFHFQLKNQSVALDCLKQIQQIAIDKNVDRIVCLGDWLNDKSLIRSEVFRQSFYFLKSSPSQWIILVGNHDYESTFDNKHHTLELFSELHNVYIVDRYLHFQDLNVHATPFFRNIDDLVCILNKIPPRSIVLGHQSINGFSYSSGFLDRSRLTKAHYKRFKKVYLGDIHQPQVQDNITYVGSPFTQNFGESGEKKRILIVDLDTLEEESIELKLPQHILLNVKIKSVDELSSILLVGEKDDYVKIVVEAPLDVLKKVNKSMFLDKFNNVILQKKPLVSNNKSVLISENLSYLQMVQTYIDTLETKIDKKDLYKLNKEVLEKISNAD